MNIVEIHNVISFCLQLIIRTVDVFGIKFSMVTTTWTTVNFFLLFSLKAYHSILLFRGGKGRGNRCGDNQSNLCPRNVKRRDENLVLNIHCLFIIFFKNLFSHLAVRITVQYWLDRSTRSWNEENLCWATPRWNIGLKNWGESFALKRVKSEEVDCGFRGYLHKQPSQCRFIHTLWSTT